METPCYKCEKRHVGCHATCALYLEWTHERNQMHEARKKANAKNDVYMEHISKVSRDRKKRNKR